MTHTILPADADGKTAWAQSVARDFLKQFEDSPSIDTANYRLCGVALEAVRLVVEDAEIARRVGEKLEPRRPGDDWREGDD